MAAGIWFAAMTLKQWGISSIMALDMNIPLTVGSDGMDLAVTIVTGLALVLMFVHWIDRREK